MGREGRKIAASEFAVDKLVAATVRLEGWGVF
jgi:hypothetical protein